MSGRLQSLSLFTFLLLFCLSGTSTAQQEELLDPNIAFVPTARTLDDGRLEVTFNIAEDYYLYRHAFKFASQDEPVTLGQANIPKGKIKQDDWFGEVETYRQNLQITLPWSYQGDVAPQSFYVEVGYQGCADIGVCFPPQKQLLQFVTTGASQLPSSAAPIANNAAPTVTNESSGALAEQDRIAASLSQGTTWLTLLTFFGFGLLLAFTPCVFPMIPILSGIIIGQGDSITTRKAFMLSLVYVLAMALTYTVAGIIVGLSGENVQALFQNPWILSSFAAVFVLLSLSMFGFYELQMPNAIQSKLTSISNSQQGGTLLGAAIMGLLSALIVGPCVTAPLIGALIYIAQTGDAMLGGAALFALSMGMGLPLIVIGTSAGKLMPKAGNWMEAIKAFFGVLLLAVAIWLLSRILPNSITMALYAVLLIVSSIYLGALEPLQTPRNSWPALWKGIGIIALIYGLMLLIGAASGSGSMLHPLKGLTTSHSGAAQQQHVAFKPIKGLEGLEAAIDEAVTNNQPVMLDFYADWCVSCKEMEAFTFTDQNVQDSLDKFMLIQADVTANDQADKALLKELGLFGPPAIIFYDRDGSEIEGQRVVGFVKAAKFNAHLQQVLEKS